MFDIISAIEEQVFVTQPENLSVVEGATAILKCKVKNKQGILQWTRNNFALGKDRNLPSFDRYSMVGNDNASKYPMYVCMYDSFYFLVLFLMNFTQNIKLIIFLKCTQNIFSFDYSLKVNFSADIQDCFRYKNKAEKYIFKTESCICNCLLTNMFYLTW